MISTTAFTEQDDKPKVTRGNTTLSDAQNKLTENSLHEPSIVVTREVVEGYAGMTVEQVAAKIVGQVLERVVMGAVDGRRTEEEEGRKVSGERWQVCDRHVLRCIATCTHTHKYTRAHTHTNTHVHTHTHTHTHTHAHTHTHTHTHTHARTHTHTDP